MFKLLKLFLIFTSFSLFTACADKVPFTPSKNLENSALVYIYVPNETTASNNVDSAVSYRLKIGNEAIKNYISDGEYMVFHIKPSKTTFYALKDSIIKHKVEIDLKKNSTYFLKISKLEDDSDFSFHVVSKEEALKEIVHTVLANSVKIEKDSINTNIIKETPKQTTHSLSKIDEIQKIYKLKEEGALTEDEFKKLKQQILSE